MRLIDADELLQNIRHAVYTDDLTTTIAVGICESHVKDMPTVDAKPVRHGRWIPDTAFGNDVMGYAVICSVCGQGQFQGNTNYCPNCGARMDLEEDDG